MTMGSGLHQLSVFCGVLLLGLLQFGSSTVYLGKKGVQIKIKKVVIPLEKPDLGNEHIWWDMLKNLMSANNIPFHTKRVKFTYPDVLTYDELLKVYNNESFFRNGHRGAPCFRNNFKIMINDSVYIDDDFRNIKASDICLTYNVANLNSQFNVITKQGSTYCQLYPDECPGTKDIYMTYKHPVRGLAWLDPKTTIGITTFKASNQKANVSLSFVAQMGDVEFGYSKTPNVSIMNDNFTVYGTLVEPRTSKESSRKRRSAWYCGKFAISTIAKLFGGECYSDTNQKQVEINKLMKQDISSLYKITADDEKELQHLTTEIVSTEEGVRSARKEIFSLEKYEKVFAKNYYADRGAIHSKLHETYTFTQENRRILNMMNVDSARTQDFNNKRFRLNLVISEILRESPNSKVHSVLHTDKHGLSLIVIQYINTPIKTNIIGKETSCNMLKVCNGTVGTEPIGICVQDKDTIRVYDNFYRQDGDVFIVDPTQSRKLKTVVCTNYTITPVGILAHTSFTMKTVSGKLHHLLPGHTFVPQCNDPPVGINVSFCEKTDQVRYVIQSETIDLGIKQVIPKHYPDIKSGISIRFADRSIPDKILNAVMNHTSHQLKEDTKRIEEGRKDLTNFEHILADHEIARSVGMRKLKRITELNREMMSQTGYSFSKEEVYGIISGICVNGVLNIGTIGYLIVKRLGYFAVVAANVTSSQNVKIIVPYFSGGNEIVSSDLATIALGITTLVSLLVTAVFYYKVNLSYGRMKCLAILLAGEVASELQGVVMGSNGELEVILKSGVHEAIEMGLVGVVFALLVFTLAMNLAKLKEEYVSNPIKTAKLVRGVNNPFIKSAILGGACCLFLAAPASAATDTTNRYTHPIIDYLIWILMCANLAWFFSTFLVERVNASWDQCYQSIKDLTEHKYAEEQRAKEREIGKRVEAAAEAGIQKGIEYIINEHSIDFDDMIVFCDGVPLTRTLRSISEPLVFKDVTINVNEGPRASQVTFHKAEGEYLFVADTSVIDVKQRRVWNGHSYITLILISLACCTEAAGNNTTAAVVYDAQALALTLSLGTIVMLFCCLFGVILYVSTLINEIRIAPRQSPPDDSGIDEPPSYNEVMTRAPPTSRRPLSIPRRNLIPLAILGYAAVVSADQDLGYFSDAGYMICLIPFLAVINFCSLGMSILTVSKIRKSFPILAGLVLMAGRGNALVIGKGVNKTLQVEGLTTMMTLSQNQCKCIMNEDNETYFIVILVITALGLVFSFWSNIMTKRSVSRTTGVAKHIMYGGAKLFAKNVSGISNDNLHQYVDVLQASIQLDAFDGISVGKKIWQGIVAVSPQKINRIDDADVKWEDGKLCIRKLPDTIFARTKEKVPCINLKDKNVTKITRIALLNREGEEMWVSNETLSDQSSKLKRSDSLETRRVKFHSADSGTVEIEA